MSMEGPTGGVGSLANYDGMNQVGEARAAVFTGHEISAMAPLWR